VIGEGIGEQERLDYVANMHYGRMYAYSIAFAVVRHSLKEPPQPGIIVSPAGMSLATAVPGIRVTSADWRRNKYTSDFDAWT